MITEIIVMSMILIAIGIIITITGLRTVKQTDICIVERFENMKQCYQIFDKEKLRSYNTWK